MYFAVFPTGSMVHSLSLFPNIHPFDGFKSLKCLLDFWFSLSFPHVLLQKLKYISQQNTIERGLWHNLLGKGSLIWQHSCGVLLPESQLHQNHVLLDSPGDIMSSEWVMEMGLSFHNLKLTLGISANLEFVN